MSGVGVTTQRASTVVWDRATGEPVAPGLGWQDLRTVMACITAKAEHGFALAPNQSATKVAAILDQVDPGAPLVVVGPAAARSADHDAAGVPA